MRVSVDPNDPGYRNFKPCLVCFLDGEPVDYAITADEEIGYVLAHFQRADGSLCLNADQNDTVKIELRGKVEIRRREWKGKPG